MARRKKGICGAGTVFHRKDGRWEATFKVEETGKFKSLYGKTEAEAYEKLDKALLEVWLAVAITTGMRLGEITGLHWDDCDLEKGLIEIRRSVAYLVDEYIEGPPKTERSERTIPISPTVCALLKKHRIRQNEERLKVGEKWQDKNIVYCNQTGGYVYSNTFRKGFASLLDKAGLPSMHIHDLRHTASTLMQSLGVSPKAVQEMLGHSHLSQTGEYTHVLLSMQQQASERFEDLPMIIFPENTHLKIEQVSL